MQAADLSPLYMIRMTNRDLACTRMSKEIYIERWRVRL